MPRNVLQEAHRTKCQGSEMQRRWEARHPLVVPSRNNILNQALESGPANSDDASPRAVPQVRHTARCIPASRWDIYLGFIQKCLSLRKYVNCHPLAQLRLPLPTAVFDKFQYLHFSLALECSRLNRGSLNMEQSSRLALQKEPGPHPGRIPSAVTLNLSAESEAFTSFVLRSSTTAKRAEGSAACSVGNNACDTFPCAC